MQSVSVLLSYKDPIKSKKLVSDWRAQRILPWILTPDYENIFHLICFLQAPHPIALQKVNKKQSLDFFFIFAEQRNKF